jgi:hypothetical protein
MISVDFFIAPTVRRQILFVFLVLSIERRYTLSNEPLARLSVDQPGWPSCRDSVCR